MSIITYCNYTLLLTTKASNEINSVLAGPEYSTNAFSAFSAYFRA